MLKHLLTIATVSALAMGATTTYAAPISKGSVNLKCDAGKHLTVNYKFNKQGLPTQASFKANGRTQVLPIDLASSDIAGTNFKNANYMLGTEYLDTKTYKKASVLITNARTNQITHKNCNPR